VNRPEAGVLAAVGLAATLTVAQAAAQQPPVFPVALDLVNVTVTVHDPHGGVVSNLAEQDFTDEEIWQLQRRYLQRLLTGKKLGRLLPAALDLVDYHYQYAAALLSPQPELPTDREIEKADLLAVRFSRAPGARLARFSYEVFDFLEKTKPGRGGEIQLTDALLALANDMSLYALVYEGKSYDAGDKLGFLKATVEFGLGNPEFGKDFREYLKELKL